ncbi:MAG: pyruvate, phosphate dikinase, partial [Pseudomonadota bacterium]
MGNKKYVYVFRKGKADGEAGMKNLLGGKGANLAEMANLEIPVPAGFTITTEVCTYFMKNKGQYPESLKKDVEEAIIQTGKAMGKSFGDLENPLLVSVRSGARMSMPGMMETVLNVGLTSKTMPGLIARSGNERFVWDAYRRLITMYSDVVLEKAAGREPGEGQGIREILEKEMNKVKQEKRVKADTDLDAKDLKKICSMYKEKVKEVLGVEFPDDPMAQLWGGIGAVFKSWNGKRAVSYRNIERIPHEWGTAVNVQSMVFGNMGNDSATGVAFTRNPATGENYFYGEFLINAQGEDVVAGIRTPQALNEVSKSSESGNLPSLETAMPEQYKALYEIRNNLEKHYRDMQDIEFTIENKKLYMLQTRTGKRNGAAAVRMAVEMQHDGLISKEEAILRVRPDQINEFLLPMLDPDDEIAKASEKIATGLPAGPGGAVGKIVFTADDAEEWAKRGEKVILVRNETSPEDVHGMHAAEAILTAQGGMTSHAALVARGWGKCCIVGCGALNIDVHKKQVEVKGQVLKEGDYITLNGTRGIVYKGQINLLLVDPAKNDIFQEIMKWADETRKLGVRTNADTPDDAAQARRFGAEGIGLCRTEHMFFGPDRILPMREMILAETRVDREKALSRLLPFQRDDFKGILKAMEGLPVTIRTLDPPLHEFLPHEPKAQEEVARELGIDVQELKRKVASLHEFNPMLGHRGCRLGIVYPEITAMQARAILEAACSLRKEGVDVFPEIMIPLIGTKAELEDQKAVVIKTADEVFKQEGISVEYMVGTMIEIPRAAITAGNIAEAAQFFSFGTNDLTQMTYGYSRDDIGSFLPDYLEKNILPGDPFQSLDQEGVGFLIEHAVKNGRATNPKLKVGICGEHGGDPAS